MVKTPSLRDLLSRKKRKADCDSIVGDEICDILEDEDLKMSGLKTRAIETGIDPGALILRNRSVPWRNNSSGGITATVGKRRADFWWLLDGFVNLILLDAETGKRYTSSDRSIGTLPHEEAMQVAQAWLSGQQEGFIELEDAHVILRSRIRNAGHGPDVVEAYIESGGNMQIPSAEYTNPRSDHDVTPNLRSMIQRTTGLTPTPNLAPVSRSRPVAPAATGGLTIAQLNHAVTLALAPLMADIAALKASPDLVTRTVRRAVAPQVSRDAVRSAMGLGPSLTVRTVEHSVHGGLPARRPVFTAKEVSRRSYGLPMVERSIETRPGVFRSRYQPEAQFPTAAARDFHEAGLQQPAGVVSPGTPARLEGPSV